MPDLNTEHPHELEFVGEESSCSYLDGRSSLMRYRIAMSLTEQRYEALLERGWRRFGRTLFRPECRTCNECQSLRVDIAGFKPSRSQRKAYNRNSDIELAVQRPTITAEHIELYNAYHLDMQRRRDWPFREIDIPQYHEAFIEGGFSFAREFQYRHNGRLIALGIVDMTGNVMSSIYFFHAPEYRDQALGTMSVLREIETGLQTDHKWLYLGYYIRDCGSMNYKNRFEPHQILSDYVADSEQVVWDYPRLPSGEQ